MDSARRGNEEAAGADFSPDIAPNRRYHRNHRDQPYCKFNARTDDGRGH